jgi:hypothetical protein
METASDQAPAVDATLPSGADSAIVTLYRASELTGIGVPTIATWIAKGALEARVRRPRGRRVVTLVAVDDVVAIAETRRTAARQARVRRSYVDDPEATLKSVAALYGISEQAAFRAVNGAARGNREAPTARIARVKAERSLLDRQELAEAAGCSIVTVGRYRRAGVLSVERVDRIDLFPHSAIAELARARAEAHRRHDEVLAAARRAGTKPRRGELVACACECGRSTYIFGYRLRGRPERRFYASLGCWARHRWKIGAVSRELVTGWPSGSGRARQRWLGRWDGRRYGHLGGRPKITATDVQIEEIRRLAASGWGRRAIASRLRLSEWAVRRALDA